MPLDVAATQKRLDELFELYGHKTVAENRARVILPNQPEPFDRVAYVRAEAKKVDDLAKYGRIDKTTGRKIPPPALTIFMKGGDNKFAALHYYLTNPPRLHIKGAKWIQDGAAFSILNEPEVTESIAAALGIATWNEVTQLLDACEFASVQPNGSYGWTLYVSGDAADINEQKFKAIKSASSAATNSSESMGTELAVDVDELAISDDFEEAPSSSKGPSAKGKGKPAPKEKTL